MLNILNLSMYNFVHLTFSWTGFCFRDELKQIVISDLKQLLGVEGEPTFLKYVSLL